MHNKSGFGGVGATGGVPPCQPFSWSGQCSQIQSCIDPFSPTREHVTLDQPVAFDAGVEARLSTDAGPIPDAEVVDSGFTEAGSNPDSGEAGVSPDSGIGVEAIGAAICGGGKLVQHGAYLAFDVFTQTPEPRVGIFSGNVDCFGEGIGEARFGHQTPPPMGIWTSQCVRVPPKYLDRVTLVPSRATFVANPRFVSSCACPRPLTLRTVCGIEGSDAGDGCD